MKKLLITLAVLCCTALPALAQTAITLPIAANAVADLGNGPTKARLVSGNASIFTSQGSGLGSTSGSSTALTLTTTPATPPIVGALISGAGITSGTTVTAYNGTTGITLSAAMTVPASTPLAWGAACPSSSAGIPSAYIQASASAGYYIMYTQARVCAVSPGGPVNTLLIEPVFSSSSGSGGGGVVTPAALTQSNDTNVTLTLTGTPATALLQAVQIAAGWTGTLAAGRLNANVVQAFTNDTNITASITAQNAAFAWSGTLAVARGGTGGGTASGTLLDNITGFSSTGLLQRTGAGAYSFVSNGTLTIASGALTLNTTTVSSAACSTAQTATATGTATTDAIIATFNGDPTAVTGYVPLTTGMLTIIPYPTSNTVNFKVCNNTGASITPGAVTINWRVVR